jgi:hypothetical protein
MTDTITDNEVLAKFENLPPQNEDGTGYVHEDEDGLTWGYSAEELEYDKKFSWLMPVWYKFRDLDMTELNRDDYATYRGYWNNITLSLPLHSISKVFEKIVEAIKWV